MYKGVTCGCRFEMQPVADDKTKKLRPQVLPISIATARKIITRHLNAEIANSLSDGDAIDLALELSAQSGE